MVKVLHTADWHIGKTLHRYDLTPDIEMFLDWLIQYIENEKIDVLLVSGDVFDLANPSNIHAKLYYRTIASLAKLGTKIIITGGNHDSVSLLDAPSALFDALDITVIGGARENMTDEVIPIYDRNSVLQCVILAVPYLRDKDLRVSSMTPDLVERYTSTAAGIKNHYDTLVEYAVEMYGLDIPIIAMGHLFLSGSITSDSERDIHVGTLDGFKHEWLHPLIQYMALGHIHKPQRVGGNNHIRYCGSPIFLDFSERDYDKMMIVIGVDDHKISTIESVPIPVFRKLIRLTGTFEEVTSSVIEIESSDRLPTLVEFAIKSPPDGSPKTINFDQWLNSWTSEQVKVIKYRYIEDNVSAVSSMQKFSGSIQDMKPIDVFLQCMKDAKIGEDEKDSLLICFHELMDELPI